MEFIRYNNWANGQVLQACQKLSEEQLASLIPGAYGTIRDTLEHIIRGETYYLRLLTGSYPRPPFKWETRPGLVEMAAYAAQVGQALEDMAQRILPTDPVFEEADGKQYRYQALAVFIQIINHGIEHRTNITTILNQGLLTPPEVDGWGYLEAHAERFEPQGYLAVPPGGKGAGVLVLHAWWGLNETIKAFCRQLAQSGFVAFAPDLYHGKIAEDIPDAEALVSALDANHLQAKAEIAQAARFLNERAGGEGRGLAVIGFSMGAYYALDLSAADPEHIHSVVLFYGSGPGDFSSSKAAYLGHFAEEDEYEPQSNVDELEEALRGAGRPVTLYHYPGTGHWFCEPDRTQAYNPAAASLAWERTLDFLKRA